MADFSVLIYTLENKSSSLNDYKKKLKSYSSKVQSIKNSMPLNGDVGIQIKKAMKESSENLRVLSETASSFSSVLKDVGNKYLVTEAEGVGDNDKFSLFKLLNSNPIISGSLFSGSATSVNSLFGKDLSTTVEGDILGYSVKRTSNSTLSRKLEESPDKKNWKIEEAIEAEGHIAKGKIKNSIGLFSSEVAGTVGSVGAKGGVGLSLLKDGKFSPSAYITAKGEASALNGEFTSKFGTDKNNTHINGKGTLLGAEAEATGNVGYITYEENGVLKKEFGVQGKVGAEAYLAKGRVSSGLSIFGVKIDVGVSGTAGGVGGTAEVRYTTGGFSGKINASLLLGLGLDVNVDWSDFSLW